MPQSTYETHEASKFGVAERAVQKMRDINEWASTALAASQQPMEDSVNEHRKAPDQFKPGDDVGLILVNIILGLSSRKLDRQHVKYRVVRQVAPLT